MGLRTSGTVVHLSAYRVVWCSKYRKPVLVDSVAKDLEAIIRALAEEKDSIIIDLEITPDSVRLVVDVPPEYGIAEFVRNAKGRSARYLRATYPHLKRTMPSLWVHSYFVATGAHDDQVGAMESYISTQRLRGE